MQKRILLAAVIFLSFSFKPNLSSSKSNSSGLKILDFSGNRLSIEWNLESLRQSDIKIENEFFSNLEFDECNFTNILGKPQIPYKEFLLAVPEGAQVEFLISGLKKYNLENKIPAPAFVTEIYKKNNTIQNIQIDKTDYNFLPLNNLEIEDQQYFRNMPIRRVKFYPVTYNQRTKTIHVIQSARLDFIFKNGNQNGQRYFPKSKIDVLYNKVILNFDQAKNWLISPPKKLRKSVNFPDGPWYKIQVSKDGLYKITQSALVSAGVNISTLDPRTIQIYNNGGKPLNTNALATENNPTEPIENAIYVLGQDDGNFDSQDYVLFYGKQLGGWNYSTSLNDFNFVEHPYDKQNYYWLTFGHQTGKRMQEQNTPVAGATITESTFLDRRRFEEDKYNLLSSGSDWYGQRFFGQNANAKFNQSLNYWTGNTDPAKFRIKFIGGNGNVYLDNDPYKYWFSIFFNTSINSSALFTNRLLERNASIILEKTFSASDYLRNGTNEVVVEYTANYESCNAYLDWIEFYYPHDFTAINNYLEFYTNSVGQIVHYTISGFNKTDVRLFDVSDQTNVLLLNTNTTVQNNKLEFNLDLTQNVHKRLIASSLTSASINIVSSIQPFTPVKNLYNQSLQSEFIIITHPSYTSYAQEIADLRAQGSSPVSSTVVDTRDIYFHFSSGVQDPVAIRNFIRHAYNNWNPQPSFVLLFGDGHYDYRNIALSDTMHVPPFEISYNHDLTSRETDNFYVDVNLGSSNLGSLVPDLAIGRLPVESHLDARRIVDKLKAYEYSQVRDGWQTVLTFVGDDEVTSNNAPPQWGHQSQAYSLSMIPSIQKFLIKRIFLSAYNSVPGGFGRVKPEANQAIIDQVNEGTLIINYVGHGSAQQWAHENVLDMNRDLNRVQNEGRLTLWIAATCTFGKYDDPQDPSFSEALIWKENEGAIGVVAATRAVYSGENYAFNDSFIRNLFPNGKPSVQMGIALLHSTLGGTNYQKFHLFADPTMHLADPRNEIMITTVSPDTLKALSKVNVSGFAAETNSANIWQNFNGGAALIVNDAKFDSVNTGGGLYYSLLGPRIFKGEISIESGLFNGEFIVPKSIRYRNKKSGRITMYAWNESGAGDAMGYVDTLLFNGSKTNLTDESGPDISMYFEGQESFNNGDLVQKNALFVAELNDESGINLTREVGHTIEIKIDDEQTLDVTSFFAYERNSYSSGELRYHIENMKPGEHTLSIQAWDNLNNPSKESINFRVVVEAGLVLSDVVNYPNPFAEETSFTFQAQGVTGATEVEIKIYTISGRLIRKLNSSAFGIVQPGFNHLSWDGRDEDGDKLANGVYLYKIKLKNGNEHKEAIEKLVVLR